MAGPSLTDLSHFPPGRKRKPAAAKGGKKAAAPAPKRAKRAGPKVTVEYEHEHETERHAVAQTADAW